MARKLAPRIIYTSETLASSLSDKISCHFPPGLPHNPLHRTFPRSPLLPPYYVSKQLPPQPRASRALPWQPGINDWHHFLDVCILNTDLAKYVDLMLGQRLRRWFSLKSAFVQRSCLWREHTPAKLAHFNIRINLQFLKFWKNIAVDLRFEKLTASSKICTLLAFF